MQVSNPSGSTLKCPTCKLNFNQDSLHKEHYKSDFHRYNLKRTMVNLPPATLQQFSTKRTQVKNQKQSSFQCGQCRKTFASIQTLNQHAQTKKHNIRMIRQQKPKVQKPQIYIKNQKRCLFCAKEFQTLQVSLKHMSIQHGFFIAQQNFCSDKAKLILYLQQKTQVGMMCIFCDNKGTKDFLTGQAVRNHMVSKCHTFMNTEKGFQEYENFYDFSQLFKEKLEEQKFFTTPVGITFEKVKVIVDDQKVAQQLKKAAKISKKSNKNEGQQKQEQDGEWQDDQQEQEQWQDESDDQNSQQNQDETAIKQENEQQMNEKRRRKIKTYQIMVPTLTSTDELLLPNGKTLGHRKYRHIYRQAIKMNNWFQNNNTKMLESGAHQQALTLRNNLLQLIRKENILKTHLRNQDKKYVKSGIQNSNLFRHFRSSNPL